MVLFSIDSVGFYNVSSFKTIIWFSFKLMNMVVKQCLIQVCSHFIIQHEKLIVLDSYLKMFWVLECYLQIWWPSGSQNALCSNKSTARNLPSELRRRWLLRLLIHLLVYPVHYVNQTGECGYDCIFMKCNLKNLSSRTI